MLDHVIAKGYSVCPPVTLVGRGVYPPRGRGAFPPRWPNGFPLIFDYNAP